MKNIYKVRAVRWSGGWELHIEGEGVTQVRTLDQAEDQVRSYLETLYDVPADAVVVEVAPDLGGLEKRVAEVRRAGIEAAEAQVAAAVASRLAAKTLRESGLSVTDTAAVMGVSRGRVSQLVKESN